MTSPANEVGTNDIVRHVGATYRMIEHWARRGVLESSTPARGSGSRRRFDEQEQRIAAALMPLATDGGAPRVTLDLLRRIATTIRTTPGVQWVRIDRTRVDGVDRPACDGAIYLSIPGPETAEERTAVRTTMGGARGDDVHRPPSVAHPSETGA